HLLIKAWGAGFWSDVDHVLGSLLLAEMTGRTPVVRWGARSLFAEPHDADAWGVYFEPVSAAKPEELTGRGFSYVPAKWNDRSLASDGLNLFRGPGSRLGALHFLNRPEDVAVCDFHVGIRSILPWLRPGHRLHGVPIEEVYRDLLRRHVRPRAQWLAR